MSKGIYLAVVAAMSGVGVAGCSSTGSSTQTVTRTVTKTVTAPAQPQSGNASASTSTPSTTQSAGSPQTYSGNGTKSLGTIPVAKASTLHWTNDGSFFAVMDSNANISVSSQAHSGSTAVDPGSYNDVTVNALGNWTITITPNG